MDIVLGIKVSDGVVIATSKAATRGISILKDTDDKTRDLSDHNLMAFTGESGDTVQFAEYIQANIQLYNMREGHELSPYAVSHFVRNTLAKSLRSRKPYQVNALLAGYDTDKKTPSLSWIDYLGTKADLPYAAHGYAAFYTLSLLDHHYRKDMTVEDGLRLLKLCNKELNTRMPIDFKGLQVKVVNKDGVKVVDGEW
ncbi:20S proteasome subunit beta type-4 [Komagataella phaffii CBS 7435]|uniref:Proteasome subunit beta n=2 Tax=Komagataella phaffii TaxID=460519 RepID=C4QXH3_KOMPG|nr:Beta 4 subunit of the 20S proteasome [Komagataella phaffii GS115]AOA60942.1 GQ67_02069T0 [Komagataella phaffii]CAH2446759.1 20S proteasome subunit beta type-4 [Komagataella phaffii CBS 7435]AOA66075.1 GQ68_02084T0 [Komagataella phaffii GS115]CAY67946.1 Beta 4 subunit of the 20S proteasome [Komagataella phaffii GS115]CCA37022.1 20S proteasome subunit beta type-4 [Komagataella phaffii CBS 7435]